MDKLRKQLAILLLIVVFATAGIHKVLGELPPDWFVDKFTDSILGSVPGAIVTSYGIIIVLELLSALFFIIALVQSITGNVSHKNLDRGFVLGYVLFVILTFGSFLVEDYGNGFKDFMYFIGVIVIEKLIFNKPELNTN